MEFTEFINTLQEKVQDKLGDTYSVSKHECVKNNSKKLTGLAIKSNDSNIAPTIYLNDYFNDYNGDIDNVVDDIIRIYMKNKNNQPACANADKFTDFNWVKDHIIFKLVNTEKNKDLLSGVPHRDMMDLSVIYAVDMGNVNQCMTSVTIRNEHIALWNVTENDLMNYALKNMPESYPYELTDINTMLMSLGMPVAMLPQDIIPMYIMTNKSRVNGASTILYEGLLNKIAKELKTDLYIIPSSIHEIIIIPKGAYGDKNSPVNDLIQIIKDVNRTEVSEEEILSDTLYEYTKSYGLNIA